MRNLILGAILLTSTSLYGQDFGYYPPANYITWDVDTTDDGRFMYGRSTPWGMYVVFSEKVGYDSTSVYSINFYNEEIPIAACAENAWNVFETLESDSSEYLGLEEYPIHTWHEMLSFQGDDIWFAQKDLGPRNAKIYFWDKWDSYYIEISNH